MLCGGGRNIGGAGSGPGVITGRAGGEHEKSWTCKSKSPTLGSVPKTKNREAFFFDKIENREAFWDKIKIAKRSGTKPRSVFSGRNSKSRSEVSGPKFKTAKRTEKGGGCSREGRGVQTGRAGRAKVNH